MTDNELDRLLSQLTVMYADSATQREVERFGAMHSDSAIQREVERAAMYSDSAIQREVERAAAMDSGGAIQREVERAAAMYSDSAIQREAKLLAGLLSDSAIRTEAQRVARLLSGRFVRASSALETIQMFSEAGGEEEISSAFEQLRSRLSVSSSFADYASARAKEIFSALEQLSEEDTLGQALLEVHAGDGEGQTDQIEAFPPEWHIFVDFLRRLVDAFHGPNGELHPSTFSVAALFVGVILAGTGIWQTMGALLVFSLWGRDFIKRAKTRPTSDGGENVDSDAE